MSLIAWRKLQAGVGTLNKLITNVRKGQLDPSSIRTETIKNAAITTAKINNLAVTTAKINDLAVDNAKINDLDASKITAGNIATARMTVNAGSSVNAGTTTISGGRIELTSATTKTGEWYDVSGVEIDTTHGINIYGTANALTTRATKAGTIQCYVGADGKLYAGAGAVWLDPDGITIKGQDLIFQDTNGTVSGYVYGAVDILAMLGDPGISIGNAVGGGIEIYAGDLVAPESNVLKLRSITHSSLASGTIDPTPAGNDIWIDSDDDIYLYADTDILLIPDNRTYIQKMGVIWGDLTASRAGNTDYQNTTGYPIFVTISARLPDGDSADTWLSAVAGVVANGADVVNTWNANLQIIITNLAFIVPVNYYYRLVLSAGATLIEWHEFKIGSS